MSEAKMPEERTDGARLTGADPAAARSLKQIAYETLKQKIITCEILPGTLLTEDMLCEELKASRTPVRDAVSRLEQERLVSIKPKRGIRVSRVSLNSIQELFAVRLELAPFIVLNYGNRISDQVYVRFLQEFSRTDLTMEESFRQDGEFHQMFVDASGNRYLKAIHEMVRDQVTRYRILSLTGNRLQSTQEEHREITVRCLSGDWEGAALRMKEHIQNSKMAIIRYVTETNRNAHNVFQEEED